VASAAGPAAEIPADLSEKGAAVPALARPSTVPPLAGLAICLLLAVAQVALAGYQLGVGNQAIQIAFLKRFADPTLYASDAMVQGTMPLYPSLFFKGLAPLLRFVDVGPLYLVLQLVTSFLTLAAVYGLGRAIFHSHASGLAAAALLVSGKLHALAGDGLYSEGFTHTFVALPLAVAALALAYRGTVRSWIGAFALAGVLFNLHALTAAYTLLMLGAALLADGRQMPTKQWIVRAALCGVAALAVAAPTLVQMLRQHQVFDAAWVNLMRVRSADHSFPSTWWTVSNPDLPRFVLLGALFVLSWSFSPLRRQWKMWWAGEAEGMSATGLDPVRRASRMTVLMTLAVAGLFVAGYVFTEIWPNATMIRLQPFRASRLLLVLMLVHIAHAAVVGIRAGISGRAIGTDGQPFALSAVARGAELVAGVMVLLTLGVPALLPLLPLTVVVSLGAALVAGHLHWRQSIAAVAALVVALLAHLQIGFPLPLFSGKLLVLPHAGGGEGTTVASLGWVAVGLAAAAALAVALVRSAIARAVVALLAFAAGGAMATSLYLREDPARDGGWETAAFTPVAAWARQHTAKDAVFLAPSGFANFRAQAERGLVADWRDGTQLYFSAGFAPTWIERVRAIEPDLALSDDGKRLLSRGRPLDTLSDEQLVELAKKYNASFIVLPTRPKEDEGAERALVSAYSDDHFTVYKPALKPVVAATRPVPPGVIDPKRWNEAETFMETTVKANIEKYRKADLTLTVLDPSGRPIQDLPVTLTQTNSKFVFGTSLGWFDPASAKIQAADGDQNPAPVRPIELETFPKIFNGSMIPFSGKWAFIEPEKGKYRWNDLDAYVEYCTKNGAVMEFHHLTGIRPPWVAQMGGPGGQTGLSFGKVNPEMQQEFLRHCDAVVGRYAGRIKYFQVSNEKYMMQYVPAAFRMLQEKYPQVQFGLSDCTNFWWPGEGSGLLRGGRGRTQYKGFDAVKWLQDQGIKPAFFSLHGHHPSNLWADPRDMYAVFDTLKEAGVRAHVTEEYLRIGGAISGPLRSGTLTPELQAEYLVRYLTVCFSHPQVDLVNLWGGLGASGWSNDGLIDGAGKPRPGLAALEKLLRDTFRSKVNATLSIDGRVKARVFHGTYTVTVTLAGGKVVTATVEVPENPVTAMTLRLDAVKGTLTP
jgi:hypothetical protein